MIKYNKGNLLDVTAGVIVHGCNAKGVMGSGVALGIKTKYPKAYLAYKDFEYLRGLRLASLSMVKVAPDLYIANLVTQEAYGRDPKVKYVSYGAVHLGFEKLQEHFDIKIPFHFPKIGAGLGNGDWNEIAKIIENTCPDRDLTCWEL